MPKTLIVVAPLACNEFLMFRYLTLAARDSLNLDVLVETENKLKDFYYKKLSKMGALDFVEQFIIPEEMIFGIRIDQEPRFPYTIIAQKIGAENVVNLLGQVKFLSSLG